LGETFFHVKVAYDTHKRYEFQHFFTHFSVHVFLQTDLLCQCFQFMCFMLALPQWFTLYLKEYNLSLLQTFSSIEFFVSYQIGNNVSHVVFVIKMLCLFHKKKKTLIGYVTLDAVISRKV